MTNAMQFIVKSFASFFVLATALAAPLSPASAEDISASGWRLWLDREAARKDDTLYLPDEVNLAKLPVNAPTGGWNILNDQQGIKVTLPTTVEEHYWGKFGTRPYTKNEAQRGAGTTFQNGNYLGVSWWWREISVPKFKSASASLFPSAAPVSAPRSIATASCAATRS